MTLGAPGALLGIVVHGLLVLLDRFGCHFGGQWDPEGVPKSSFWGSNRHKRLQNVVPEVGRENVRKMRAHIAPTWTYNRSSGVLGRFFCDFGVSFLGCCFYLIFGRRKSVRKNEKNETKGGGIRTAASQAMLLGGDKGGVFEVLNKTKNNKRDLTR